MFTFVILFAIILALFYKYIRYRQSHWNRLKVTSIEPTFLFGNFIENFLGKENLTKLYDNAYQQFKDTDKVIGIYSLLQPQLLVTDPELFKEICIKHFSSFHDTSFAHFVNSEADPLLSRNPFFLAGQEWKDKRAEITPAFSPARIKAMYPLIDDVCKRIEMYLEKKEGQSIEARDLCSRYTCDVVSNCIFAADAESFTQDEPKIRDLARKIFGAGGIDVQIRFLIAQLLPSVSRLLKIGFVPTYIQDFFTNLMAQAVENRRKLGVSRHDYLEYLLQMQGKKKVSELELAANGITFFTDGFDTSSVAIACTLYELAANKNVQERLREELKNVDGFEQIAENEYLDAVFAEALRIHPPGGFTARECTAPIELEILQKDKKLQLKKGDSLILPIYSVHRDEKIYENPLKFNPDRFTGGALKEYVDKGLFLTFGLGPRTCIGQRFARAQSKACLTKIIKIFEVELDKDKTKLPLKLDPKDFLTYYEGGLWLKFKKIQ